MQWVGAGIHVFDSVSSYGTAFANTIQDSGVAIENGFSDYWTIANNTFLFNDFGIDIYDSQNTDIYYNEFIYED